jgi:hypothetical protein
MGINFAANLKKMAPNQLIFAKFLIQKVLMKGLPESLMKLPLWLTQVRGPHIVLIATLLTAALFNHTTYRFLQIHLHAIPCCITCLNQFVIKSIARPTLQQCWGNFRCRE